MLSTLITPMLKLVKPKDGFRIFIPINTTRFFDVAIGYFYLWEMIDQSGIDLIVIDSKAAGKTWIRGGLNTKI
jgi:hypothetical protein